MCMFGGTTKLIAMGLQLGKLVDKAHMYGLLVGMMWYQVVVTVCIVIGT